MHTEEMEILNEDNSEQQKCLVGLVSNINQFGLCKTSDVNYCKHLVNYGYAKYCFHPDWQSFLEKNENKIII